MTSFHVKLLVAASLAAEGVLAGHGMFEPKLDFQRHVSLGLSDSPLNLHTLLAENATASSGKLSKRWLGIKTGSGSADTQLWPNKKIRYCYESAATRDILDNDLKEAMQRWYDSGLSADFKTEMVSDAVCKDDRVNVLYISYSTKSSMSTTPGKPPASYALEGPQMTLTDDETMGMLDKVANYAHELGHAWGLLHEHQNPRFWETAYGNQDGSTFGSTNWNCNNLKDYDTVQAKIQKNIEDNPLNEVTYLKDKTAVCTSRQKAKQYAFSAYDYLPFPLSETVPPPSTEPIDWGSIMIYPSGAGAKGDAVAGADNRAVILLKDDGTPIPINLNPSAGDVEGLERMYAEVAVTDDGPLLDDKKSTKNNIFQKIWKKSRGKDC